LFPYDQNSHAIDSRNLSQDYQSIPNKAKAFFCNERKLILNKIISASLPTIPRYEMTLVESIYAVILRSADSPVGEWTGGRAVLFEVIQMARCNHDRCLL